MLKYLIRLISLLLITLLFFSPNAMSFDKVYGNDSSLLIGTDKLPCGVKLIKGFTSLNDWITNNYTDDFYSPIFYLPETIINLDIANKEAIAFKTWEYNNFVQNILLKQNGYLLLYSTPHGKFNPDGNNVFTEILGITLPKTIYTDITEDSFLPYSLISEKPSMLLPLGPSNLIKDLYGYVKFGVKVGSYNSIDAFSNGATRLMVLMGRAIKAAKTMIPVIDGNV